ncbi:MAG: PAS domain S-box protein [Anaerolineales bacterium]|nr:PAS domain S-box protein [Anaerolineales bacterium]
MKSNLDISINKQIMIPPLVFLLFLTLFSLFSYTILNNHLALQAQTKDALYEKSFLINSLYVESEQLLADTFQIQVMRSQNCPDESVEMVQERLERGLDTIHQDYGQIIKLPTLDQAERDMLARIRPLLDASQVDDLIQAGTTQEIDVAFEFINTLEDLVAYQHGLIDQAAIESAQSARTTSATVIITGMLIAAIGTLSTVIIGGLVISRPIRHTIEQMRLLVQGDMDIDIKFLDREDEIGSMARAIELLRKNSIEKENLTRALEESTERFRELFNNMSSGVIVYEAINNGYDFIIKDLNKSVEETCQYKKEDVVGKDILKVFPGTRETGFDKILHQVYSTGKPVHLPEYLYQDERLKQWVSVYVYSLPSGELVAVHENITGRRQAEEKLAEHRRMLSTLMSNLPGMAYRRRNDMERTMEFVSEGCLGLTGYRPFDLILNKKLSYAKVIHPEDIDYVWKRVQSGLKSSGRYQLVYRINTAEGKEKWVWEQGSGIYSPDGELICLEGFISDITERKLAEQALEDYSGRLAEIVNKRSQELEKAQEQLVRSEKLAVLGQLAGGIAHELRNPLGAIKNISYFLNMALESPDAETQEAIDALAHEVNAADRIINSLLDFARTRSLNKIELDINSVVMESLLRVSPAGSHDIELISYLEDSLPPVWGDFDQLVQLFSNLIQNAIQALDQPIMEPGEMSTDLIYDPRIVDDSNREKRVIIRTSITSRDGDSEWAQVSITDTGIGIPPENLSKVFEPLFSTKAKGIGLGLALARILVEEHGGQISIDSQVGQGSTFTVSFPVYQSMDALK